MYGASSTRHYLEAGPLCFALHSIETGDKYQSTNHAISAHSPLLQDYAVVKSLDLESEGAGLNPGRSTCTALVS